jgi:hypothetical protein
MAGLILNGRNESVDVARVSPSRNPCRRKMAELDKGKTVSLQELMVFTLAMVDAVTKLLIEKGVISEAEFAQKLLEERAVYQRLLNPTVQ